VECQAIETSMCGRRAGLGCVARCLESLPHIEWFFFAGAFLFTGFPMLLLYDLADASSECDLLVAGLNNKRVRHCSNEAHLEIQKLEILLNNLNKKQGLGFVVVSTVLDKGTFFTWMTKLVGLAATGIGSLLALHTQETDSTSQGECKLDKSAEQVLQATVRSMVGYNASCSYNFSV
jgi:hypothetical protein